MVKWRFAIAPSSCAATLPRIWRTAWAGPIPEP